MELILVVVLIVILGVILLRFGRAIALGLLGLAGLAVMGLLAMTTLNHSRVTRQAVRLAKPGIGASAGWVLALLVVLAVAGAVAYFAMRWAVRERRLRHELERNLGAFGSRGRGRQRRLPRQGQGYPAYPVIYDLDDIEAPDSVDEPLWWSPTDPADWRL